LRPATPDDRPFLLALHGATGTGGTNAAAFRLYRREGLEVVGETTTHLLMSSRTGRI
jgi:hypothetical protein